MIELVIEVPSQLYYTALEHLSLRSGARTRPIEKTIKEWQCSRWRFSCSAPSLTRIWSALTELEKEFGGDFTIVGVCAGFECST